MKRILQGLLVVALLIAPIGWIHAEKVADLPKNPGAYVNDYAGVLSPTTKQTLEDLCSQVDKQAHSQIAVATIKTLDDDQSIDEFTTQLEEKWGVGKKGNDQSVLMVIVMSPKKWRIEVGYGLEGILNDAKVGDIGRAMVPALSAADYNTAIPLGINRIAEIIATDAGVTLTSVQHTYHREQAAPVHLSLWQVVLGGAAALFILVILVKTGNVGLIFFLLGNLMGGGGGGRRGGGGDGEGGGGGFGGFGGGSSGGGGASGDY